MNTRRPSVVVILTDQQRWDTTGAGGNSLGVTPAFDRLATRGTYAATAITPNPVCAPARAAMQTGMYPSASGCFRNQLTLDSELPTLAACFHGAGYATGYIGKWHLGDPDVAGPVEQGERGGYQDWLAANVLEHTSDAYNTVVYDDEGDPVRLPGYRADALTDAAIRYAADHSDEPFLLFLSLLEPHQQNETDSYDAPEGYAEQYIGSPLPPDLAALGNGSKVHEQIGGYYGQIKRVDECLGRLMDALRSLHILEDTIVAFTSDHGCHFRTRVGEYKRSCHEASVRVPFAISGPGFHRGRRIEGPISTLDLPPTLLAAAGIAVPDTMQGSSLLERERSDAVLFQVSESEVGRGLRTRRWKYYVTAPDAHAWNDRHGHRYVESALYDLENDPSELENLIGQESSATVTSDLRRRLAERMIDVGEPEPVIEPATTTRKGRHLDPRVGSIETSGFRFGHQRKAVDG
ncbi:sulfatase-like hydrolase/transferase [Ruania halotolerans]|uniref:sulfatase-like hydrolase/transferase n=1 Tax=Ruania halotolerans TaxID=2897773 RepID=UPI001E5F4EAB|nr:sulfatase-like hydrolase/transferase [Ruania halotolerans]UFU06132.1 sulfatase-like hydrolase/transferase [Ruania halotolerans]